MRASHPPRLRCFDYVGTYGYHVVCGTWERVPHFADPTVFCAVRSTLMRQSVEFDFAVNAYCFMPDHVHLLLQGTSGRSSLNPFMKHWKQLTGYWSAQTRGQRLWQPRYFERVLRQHEPPEAVARYILANPVRAGLVKSVGEYPFAWCVWGY